MRMLRPSCCCVLLLLSARPLHASSCSCLRPLHAARPLSAPHHRPRVALQCCEPDDFPEEFDGAGRVVPSGQRRRAGPQYYLPASNDDRLREATQLVGQIRSTAALFAGFAFTQLHPPSSGEDELLGTLYSALDSATLGCELVAVFVAQQLLYRLLGGTFGAPKGTDDQSASVLGLLVSQHRLEFRTVRLSFISGIVCLLASTTVRAWCTGEPGQAWPVTVTMLATGATMAYFAQRSQEQVFKNL